ncbi:hypothetical protein [Algoriphagus sediminis]|uniref:Uncharacterized protein n=1 Tax=Algoriphagus sediminis TaxID=3057113 RepID=A0ABT7YBY3_9BACT|nr:hypothetical protein [Algoriphagus sediminis]MDN3203966.1 hypothetical protein [Algoriphagus sediminis]
MSSRSTKDPVLSPELIRILKIFGLASLLIVFALSFFDSKRANNTGEDPRFRMSQSNRLYFLNVRALSYDREVRKDAKMTLFRHDNRKSIDDEPSLDLVLILNGQKDEAYLYLEPINTDWPLNLRITQGAETKEFEMKNGNKDDHFEHVQKIKDGILEKSSFYILHEERWVPLWKDEGELEYLNIILEDYSKLIE